MINLYLLLCTASLSSGRARSLYARGRHRVGGASHTQTLERRLGVGHGFRLRLELFRGARVRLPAQKPLLCTSSWISSVEIGARSMRSSSSPASSSMIKCGFFPGLKSMTRPS